MPIAPENKHRYPADWAAIRAVRLAQVNNRCEGCGVINHAWGYRLPDGEFIHLVRSELIEQGYTQPPFWLRTEHGSVRVFEIVLTIAHLDHTPENNHPDNLRAWCQKCHLDHDRQHHIQTRARKRKRALEEGGQQCLET